MRETYNPVVRAYAASPTRKNTSVFLGIISGQFGNYEEFVEKNSLANDEKPSRFFLNFKKLNMSQKEISK